MARAAAGRVLALFAAIGFVDAWVSRGPNSCTDLALTAASPLVGSFCCRGWSTSGESRLCVKPICKSDCGSGTCVSPNRCGCSDGTLKTSCVGDGEATDERQGHGRARSAHAHRKSSQTQPSAYPTSSDLGQLGAACIGGSACADAQAQEAAHVEVSSKWPRDGVSCPDCSGPAVSGSDASSGGLAADRMDCFEKRCSTELVDSRGPSFDFAVADGREPSPAMPSEAKGPAASSPSSAEGADFKASDGLIAGQQWGQERLAHWDRQSYAGAPDREAEASSLVVRGRQFETEKDRRGTERGGRPAANRQVQYDEEVPLTAAGADRTEATDYYVQGRANDVYVKARIATPELRDQGVENRMSSDAVDSGRPARANPFDRASLFGGLQSIAAPLFSAGKPTVVPRRGTFAAGAIPTGNSPLGTVLAASSSTLGRAKVAPPSGSLCSRGLPAASGSGTTLPCGGGGSGSNGVADGAGAYPCGVADSACSGRQLGEVPKPAGLMPVLPALCSPGYVPVTEGDLIVCEKVTGFASLPCDSGVGGSDCVPTDETACAGGGGCARSSPVETATCSECQVVEEPDVPVIPPGSRSGGGGVGRLQPAGAGGRIIDGGIVAGADSNIGGCGLQSGFGCGAGSTLTTDQWPTPCGSSDCDSGDSGRSSACQLLSSLGLASRGCRGEKVPKLTNANCVRGSISKRDGSCECHTGFWGERCDKDFDECDAGLHDCTYGCFNTVGSYKCVCAPGTLPRTGNDCYVKPCPQCLHGGRCFDGRCVCPSGFRGTLCEQDIDECQEGSSACSQMCRNTFGSHVCLCKPGFRMLSDNRTCEEMKCKHPCLNGGECIRSQCICTEGYVGVACQFEARKMGKKRFNRRR